VERRRGEKHNLLVSKFYAEHRDYLIGEEAVKGLQGLECMAWFQDYMHEEVRRVRLEMMEEACTRYDIDGFQYDFMRCPGYFKPGQEQAGMTIMTAFMRQTRAILDRIGAQKGKRLGFSVRIPNIIKGAENLGLDVRTWMREGLVDLVTPSTFFHADQDEDMREWVEAAKGTGVGIYPCIEESYSANHTGGVIRLFYNPPVLMSLTVEMIQAIAARYYYQGVDGVYVFNWSNADFYKSITNDKEPALKVIGNRESLTFCDKTYILSRRDGLFPNCLPVHQIPVRIGETPVALRLMIADDLTKHRECLQAVTLRVHYNDMTIQDQIEVKVNGKTVACKAPLQAGQFAYAEGQGLNAAVWMEYDLRGNLPRQGENKIEFQTTKRAPRATEEFHVEAVDVELSIKYSS